MINLKLSIVGKFVTLQSDLAWICQYKHSLIMTFRDTVLSVLRIFFMVSAIIIATLSFVLKEQMSFSQIDVEPVRRQISAQLFVK